MFMNTTSSFLIGAIFGAAALTAGIAFAKVGTVR
jgi:hypothetical protein